MGLVDREPEKQQDVPETQNILETYIHTEECLLQQTFRNVACQDDVIHHQSAIVLIGAKIRYLAICIHSYYLSSLFSFPSF